MLVLVAVLSLILGMGLPTTANYIVVSSLMVSVVVELGAQSGLIVPLIAVHLFVFYFGIMADVTPPVGLASFAAAAVSGGDAIRTGLIAFFYSLRTVALPFVFIFNTDLLLIDVTWTKGLLAFASATTGMLVFTAATMGYFVTRSRLWETCALLLVTFALFRPGFFMDRLQPPFAVTAPASIEQVIAQAPTGTDLRIIVTGPDFDTQEMRRQSVVLPVPEGPDRIRQLGLELRPEGDARLLDEPMFGAPLARSLSHFDFYGDQPVQIAQVKTPLPQLPKELMFLPALLLLGLVAYVQSRRLPARKEKN